MEHGANGQTPPLPPRERCRPQGGELKLHSAAVRAQHDAAVGAFQLHAPVKQQPGHYCGFSSRVRMRSVPFMRQRAWVAFSAALEGT